MPKKYPTIIDAPKPHKIVESFVHFPGNLLKHLLQGGIELVRGG